MTLYFDVDTRSFVTSPGYRDVVSTLTFKRGDNLALAVKFCRGTTIIELASGATGKIGFKPVNNFDGDLVGGALSWTKTGTGTATVYTFDLNLNTAELNALLGVGEAADVPSVLLNMEMEYIAAAQVTSSNTILATIQNDVIRDEDETPTALPDASDWLSARAIRYDTPQSLTAPQKAQAITNIGAATPASVAEKSITEARRRRPALPQVLGRIQELSAADRTLNIYHTGDSLHFSMASQLRQYLESTIGVVGVAFFPYVLTNTLSGIHSSPTQDTTDVSKTKFWETGRISILSAGASVAIGQNIASSLSDIVANKFTLYLGREVGNGTATISVSYDGGSTWEADIETVDTSHTETGVLVKTYTLAAARLMRVRVVSASGPVQIIGAKLWDSTKCGAIVGASGRDGAMLSQYAAASSQSIRNTVMADYAPHLVTGQFSESVEEIAALPDWLDIWMEACPNADFLFTNIYDILNRDKATYTDVINAAYDSALATYPRFFLHDLAATFKSKEYLNEAGFHPLDAADVHLTGRGDMAWKAAASDLAGFMGLTETPYRYAPRLVAANSIETDFTTKGFVGGLPIANQTEIHESTSTISKVLKWFTALGSGSWRLRRRASSDAMAPFALDLRYDSDSGSISTYMLIGTDGTFKFQSINTGSTTTAGADGYRAVFAGTTPLKAARFTIASNSNVNCVDFGRGTDIMAAVDRRFQFQSDTGFAHGSTGAGPKWLSGAVAPSVTCTMTLATPGVITVTGHGFANGMIVVFSTDGALPTGIVAGTHYFVKNATANTFEVATTPTGTSRPTSGSQSGTHTVTAAATDGSIYSRSGAGGQMYVMESGVWVGK